MLIYLCRNELHPKSPRKDYYKYCQGYLDEIELEYGEKYLTEEYFLLREWMLLKSGKVEEVFDSIEKRFGVSSDPSDILKDLDSEENSHRGKLIYLYEIIGDAYFEQGEYKKAANFYDKVNKEGYVTATVKGVPENQVLHATALLRAGKLRAAEKRIRREIDDYEGRAQTTYGLNNLSLLSGYANYGTDLYSVLQELMIKQGKEIDALEVAERSKARDLASRLEVVTNADEPKTGIQSLTLSEIKDVASEQEATIVQYSTTLKNIWDKEGELLIWVIKPEGEIVFKKYDFDNVKSDLSSILDSRTFVQKLFSRIASIFDRESNAVAKEAESSKPPIGHILSDIAGSFTANSNGRGAISETLESKMCESEACFKLLYSMLIKPIENHLPDTPEQHVIFVPQGDLFRVPFPALMDLDGEYLIDSHTVRTAPSIQSLKLTRELANNASSLESGIPVVVGSPSLPSTNSSFDDQLSDLGDLKNAAWEAEEVAHLLETKPLIGENATESLIKEKITSASILHFATHGIIDAVTDEGVISSALVLSDSLKDDGLLTDRELYEIYEMDANLVVLSACNTQIGDIISEGVVSLARPFMAVGVPSVVASLWSVPDESTSNLMVEFYRNLKDDPDAALALRQAMLSTKERNKNIESWAGFTLIGEPLIKKNLDEEKYPFASINKPQKFLTVEQLENAEYTYSGMWAESVKLTDGEYYHKSENITHRFSVIMDELKATGNLDGDEQMDAVVILTENGPTGPGTRYFIPVLNQNGVPVSHEAYAISRSPVSSIAIEDGILTVESARHRDGDGNCCPSQLVREVFEFKDGRLNPLSFEKLN